MASVLSQKAVDSSTTNVTSYATASFSPTAGDLLVVFVEASDTVAATPTLTSSLGETYTLVDKVASRTGLDTLYMFIGNALVVAGARVLTFDCTGDAATGAEIGILKVTGMTKTGLTAILQTAKTANAAAGGTPAATFAAAALTGNPTVGAVINGASPAALTPPATHTERHDSGHITPATGYESVSNDSGFTGTTMTWGATSATAFGVLIAELDASAAAAKSPPYGLQRHRRRNVLIKM